MEQLIENSYGIHISLKYTAILNSSQRIVRKQKYYCVQQMMKSEYALSFYGLQKKKKRISNARTIPCIFIL
jgi:hypothetical protein